MGVPVAVIRNPYVERLGTKAGGFARWMLKGRKTKHWMRTWYALNSVRRLKKSLLTDDTSREYWQAGKSVAGIHEVKPAGQIVREFAERSGVPADREIQRRLAHVRSVERMRERRSIARAAQPVSP
jgi:hypothetical protein